MLCLPGFAGGANGIDGKAVLLPVAAESLSPSLSPSEIIPVTGSFPGMSAAIAGTTPAKLPSLPQGDAGATLAGGLYEAFKRQGESMLTPHGAADTLRGVESGGIAGLGGSLAQSVIDAGLQRIEQQAGHHFFRTLNLNWTPGFNGREDLYQIDAMLSLHDGERGSLMTQLGLQGRNGEAGANAGLVLRTRAFADWMLGLNVFYDYLSDPEVDRWSAGMELKGRWLGISSNIYIGMDEEISGSETMYSPDGWDVELSGHAPELPWLEYSGRYYKWNGELSPDLEGQDYRLTLRPVPLLDLSLRYDNAQDGDSGFGIETQLSYEFGRPMSEQLSYQRVATPASSWARRFERVRREYEQRVQSRSSAVTTSVIRLTVGSGSVVAQIGNIPAGATQVVVSGGTGLGNSLTRAAPGAPAVRVHGDNCHVVGIADATCTFTGSSGEITIANLLPGSYNFSASFQDAAGVTLGGPVQFTATITGPTASLAVDNTAIAEAGGTATVTVTLDPAPATAVTVNLTRSGSATIGAGNDYTATNLGGTDPTYSITVTANAATASFTLTAVDDTMVDAAETAIFTIASVTGYTPASGSSAVTVTITDDDGASTAPTASLAVDNTAIAEAGGTATVTVTLDPAPTTAVTVNLTRSGTATIGAGNDYTATNLGGTDPTYSIMVPANAATASFTLTAVDDTMVDAAETVIFTIASVTGYTPASGSSAVTVTITDNDDPPTASLAVDNTAIAEAGGTATVTVTLDPAPTTAVTVNLTRTGTADIGASNDYSQSGLTAGTDPAYSIMVSAGTTTASFTLTAVDDAIDDDDETAIFTIASVTGYTPASGGAAAVTVTIMDNDDPPTASLAVDNTPIAEAGGTATVTVTLDPAPTTAVTVNLTRTGTADIGASNDYSQSGLTAGTDPAAYSITVAANMATASFMLTAVDDAIDDDDETAIFTIASVTGYTPASGGAAAVTVTITDDDDAPLVASIHIGNAETQTGTIAEAGTTSITVTVSLSTAVPAGAVEFAVNLGSSGSATIVTDYTVGGLDSLPDGDEHSIRLAAGATTASFTLTAVDDSVDDDAETAVFTMVGGSGYAVAAGSAVRVSITDNDDPPTASLAVDTATIVEAGGIATVTVTLDPVPTTAVTVDLTRTGTATIGTSNDYSQTGLTAGSDPAYSITVAANMATATFTLTAVDDTIDDDDETAIFTIASGTGYMPASGSSAVTVTITDDDDPPVASVHIGNAGTQTGTIAETGTTSTTVTVSLSTAANTEGVVVSLTRTGNADIGASNDYSQSGLTAGTDPAYSIMVAAGATTASFTLTAVRDTENDAAETAVFTVVTGGSDSDYTPATGGAEAVTISITDDADPPGPVADLVATPGNGQVTLSWFNSLSADISTVIISAMITGGAVVDINVADAGNNDLSISTTPGSRRDSQTITGLSNGTGYTFSLVASDGTNSSTPATITATPVVLPEFSFQTATATGAEGAGTITVNIAFTGVTSIASNAFLQVSLGGTAEADDYNTANSTVDVNFGNLPFLFIGAGRTSPVSFTITPTTDALTEGDETLIIMLLLNTNGTYTLGDNNTYTLTITDPPPVASIHIGNADTQTGTIAEAGTTSTTVTVSLSAAAPTGGVVVSLTSSGNADIGTDYTAGGISGADPAYSIMVAAGATTASFTLTAVRDTENDTAETAVFTVVTGGSDSDYTPAIGGAEAVTVSITDDADPPGPVTVLAATPGNGQVALSWTNPSDTDLSTVIISATVTADGTVVDINGAGTAGNDLSISATPGTMGSQSITGLSNGTGYTFSLVASDGTNPSTPVTTTATPVVPIPEFSFPTTTATMAEGRSVTVNIEFTGGALASNTSLNVSLGGDAVAADYSTSSSSATANFASVNPNITINAGRTSTVVFVISPSRDALVEGDETLEITLEASTDGAYTLGANTTYTLTITDVLVLASVHIGTAGTQTGTITEASTTNTTVTVTLDPAPTTAVTVNLTRSGSAAIGTGNDYSQSGLTVVGIDPAYSIVVSANAATASFTLTAVDDSVDDDNETAIFTVTTGTGYTSAAGGAAAVTVTITDNDDPPVASVHIGNAATQEGTIAEDGTTSTMVTVSLSAAANTGGVVVSLTRSGNADIGAGNDYTAGGISGGGSAFRIIVAAGATTASFTLTAVDDSVDDDDETAIFTLTTGTGYTSAAGGAAAVTVTITDNDDPPQEFSFQTATATVAEGGNITVELAFTGGVASNTSLNVSLGGTAEAVDYSTGSGTASPLFSTSSLAIFAGTVSPANFMIFATTDALTEGDETLIITLEASTDGAYTLGANTTYTLTITDLAPPPVASIHIGNAGTQTGTIAEAGTTSTTVTVSLSTAAPTGGVVVSLTRSGMATIATDYSQTGLTDSTDPAYSIMVAAGATTASFTLTAVRDTENDTAETAVFTVTTGTGYTVAAGGAEAVTISITDDADPPGPVTGLAATPGNDQVALSWTNPSDTDLSTVIISAIVTGGTTVVDLNGAGTAGNDLSISATAGSMGSQTITGLSNGTGYTFSLVASDGVNSSTTATITATPVVGIPEFSFPTATATVAEGGSLIRVNIAFTGGALAFTTVLNVIVGGTAMASADYSTNNINAFINSANTTVGIDAGTISPATFDIRPAPDVLTEGDETLIITLLASNDGSYTLRANNTYTLTITDVPPQEFSFQTTTATVAEGGTITVELAFTGGTLASAIRLNISLGGTAMVADYSTVPGTLFPIFPAAVGINAGTISPATFDIRPATDALTESDETLVITLLDGSGYTVDSANNTYTLTITDPPPPVSTASIHIGNAGTQTGTIAEAGTTSTTVTVSLSAAAPTGGVTVNLTRSGSATIGTGFDYSQSGLTDSTDPAYSIMVAAGATTASFMLTAMDDSADDDNEIAVFTVTAGVGYTIGTAAVAVTITDNDDPPDATPPDPVTGLAAMPGNGEVALSWTNPSDTDLSTVIISAMVTGGAVVDINGAGTTGNDLSISATPGSMGSQTITGLSNGTGYTFSLVASDGTNSSTTVTTTATPVVPPPEFSFQSAGATVAEGLIAFVNIAFTGGDLASIIRLNVSLGGTAAAADYTTGNITAAANLGLAAPIIGIEAGRPSTVSFTIFATTDALMEGPETLEITLLPFTANGSRYTLGANTTFTLTITDPLPVASVHIGNAGMQAGTIAEDGPTSTTVTVSLSAAAPTGGVTVNLMRSGGATIATDYSQSGLTAGAGSAYSIMVAAGATTASFTLTAMDDTIDDDAETAIFTIASVTGYSTASGGAAAVTVTIIDDDQPEFSFQTATATVAEGGFIHVNIVFPGGALDSRVFLNATVAGSAEFGVDYTTSNNTAQANLGIAAPLIVINKGGTSPAFFTIRATTDALMESSETLIITLTPFTTNGARYALGATTTHTLTITNVP